jgi:hypothetical protein
MPHSITDGDACLAYFNKIWGMPIDDTIEHIDNASSTQS